MSLCDIPNNIVAMVRSHKNQAEDYYAEHYLAVEECHAIDAVNHTLSKVWVGIGQVVDQKRQHDTGVLPNEITQNSDAVVGGWLGCL